MFACVCVAYRNSPPMAAAHRRHREVISRALAMNKSTSARTHTRTASSHAHVYEICITHAPHTHSHKPTAQRNSPHACTRGQSIFAKHPFSETGPRGAWTCSAENVNSITNCACLIAETAIGIEQSGSMWTLHSPCLQIMQSDRFASCTHAPKARVCPGHLRRGADARSRTSNPVQ